MRGLACLSPSDLGAPSQFSAWRVGQAESLEYLLGCGKQVIGLNLPTGVGKSLIAVLASQLVGGRTVILTSTRALQDQYARVFGEMLTDVRGMQNYPCNALRDESVFPADYYTWKGGAAPGTFATCDLGPCLSGARCDIKLHEGCEYYLAVKRARHSSLVLTNYAFWLNQLEHGQGLGTFDLMVLDEAHEAPEEVAGFLAVSLSDWEMEHIVRMRWPEGADTYAMSDWRLWAREELKPRLRDRLSSAPEKGKLARRLRQLSTSIGRLVQEEMPGAPWLPQRDPRAWRWEPIWPGTFTSSVLWPRSMVKRILLMSATMRPKTLDLLGTKEDERGWYESDSPFPISHRPVYHVPTTRLTFRSSPADLLLWVNRIDQIIEGRLDRKGLVHTVSYERARLLLRYSRFAELMFVHDSASTRKTVEEFKRAEAPAILVSPVVGTGWDFPYDLCTYSIIGKLAFPDTRGCLMKRRVSEDKTYSPYLAATSLVQASGRGVRSSDDYCETFLVDDSIRWFLARHRDLLPRWWRNAFTECRTIPPAPSLPEWRKEEARGDTRDAKNP